MREFETSQKEESIQVCASLKHRKKKKAEPNRLIPLKPIENLLELSIVHYSRVSYFFRLVRIECN